MRSLKWAIHVEGTGDEKLVKRSDVQKVEGKGGGENWDWDGRTALEDIWKEWEENGE